MNRCLYCQMETLNKKFCSRKCSALGANSLVKGKKKAPCKTPNTCVKCGNVWYPVIRNQHYCDVCLGGDRRNCWRIRLYGISKPEYDLMLEKQEFKCAICGESPPRGLNVDHNHATGKVRGLLCPPCNKVLGHLEKEGWLPSALAYLQKEQSQ